jgi:hypothetical protein
LDEEQAARDATQEEILEELRALRMVVYLDHVASFIVNANHGIM